MQKKKNKIVYTVFGICVLLLLQSCSNDKYVLSRSKMEAVMYDLQLAQALTQTRYAEFSGKEQKDALLNSILEKHGITKEVLDSSLVWYSDNVDVYMRINDSIVSRLKRENIILEKQFNKTSEAKTLLANRVLPPYVYITPQKPFITFDIDSFAIKKESASSFALNFDMLGLYPDIKMNVSLLFEYADTNVTELATVTDPEFSYSIPYLEERILKNISGYLYIDSLKAESRILLYNIEIQQDTTRILSSANTNMKKRPAVL